MSTRRTRSSSEQAREHVRERRVTLFFGLLATAAVLLVGVVFASQLTAPPRATPAPSLIAAPSAPSAPQPAASGIAVPSVGPAVGGGPQPQPPVVPVPTAPVAPVPVVPMPTIPNLFPAVP